MNPLIAQKLPEIAALCKKYRVATMYLFGSATTDRFNDESDIDLLTENSLSNPYFIESVEKSKQLLYAS